MRNIIAPCCHWSQRQGLRCTWVAKSWTKDNISSINFPADHLKFMNLPASPPQRTVSALLLCTKLQLSMYNQVHNPSCFRLRVKPHPSSLSLKREETFGKIAYGAFDGAMVQNANLCDPFVVLTELPSTSLRNGREESVCCPGKSPQLSTKSYVLYLHSQETL